MKKLLVCIALATLALHAQTSSIQGAVTDSQNAIVPNAMVTLTNSATSASRKTVSADGSYQFAQVPPGNYKLEAQSPGFRTFQADVVLQINVPSTLDVKLEIGQVTEVIHVEEVAAPINTQNATIGNPFTETQVRQLPLQTRNVVELLSLQPGVTATGEVLGARRDQNNVTLDGVDVNDNQDSGVTSNNQNAQAAGAQGLTSALPVPLDSVQEFRVTIAGQGADQGRSSGGQVTLVTKSGSNQFHGSLYEFHRNVKTAANDWFSNRSGLARENLIRNQYGASLGGRIVRDKAFFFLNWEERKDRSAAAQSRNVPTETLKQGIVQFRQNDGTIGSINPSEVKAVDPLGIGVNTAMMNILKQYPVANDLAGGSDRGLNFGLYRFNAPLTRNDRAYVAKFDFNVTEKQSFMIRGTLADNKRDDTANLAQFPGQDAASKIVDNSRGLSARHQYVFSPSLVNVFNFGYTRLGIYKTGSQNQSLSFDGITPFENFVRGVGRIIPTTNLVNDLTWTKKTHTVQGGINFRLIQNDRVSYANSFQSYSFSRNTLAGLGSDASNAVNAFIKNRSGLSSLALSETQPTQRALGILLGVINQYSATYNFDLTGKSVAFGQPIARSFATNEYEFYIQDVWKIRRDLTLTYGVRYGNYAPPYETNGTQVNTTVPIESVWAQRVGASLGGVTNSNINDLTFSAAGPVNGAAGWYNRDNNNWAPRLNMAYAPDYNGFAGKLFGKGSVFRIGASMLYDRYGSSMVTNFDQSGSPGLATQMTQPINTNFSTSARYGAGSLPAIPQAPAAVFPYTPPVATGGFGAYQGAFTNLVAPYNYLLNASYARPLPGKLVIEVGYVGRLARKSLVRMDLFQPATQFKDAKSGQTWTQAAGMLRDYYERGMTAAQVPNVAFFENMFPGAANRYINGSATQNYFYTTYNTYAGSDLDALNDMDRVRQSNGTCLSVSGCNTFFMRQAAGYLAWTNEGRSSYHSGQLTLRRPVSNGWGFDFNYTLSKSIDMYSSAESGGTGTIQDSFNPNGFRGLSDFNAAHNITANTVVELPFGKGKQFLNSAPGWVNTMLGGWQTTMLWRYRSGNPLSVSAGGVYSVNYLNSSLGIVRPGATLPTASVQYNSAGNPSLFATNSVYTSIMGAYPGTTGTRAMFTGPSMSNFDLSLGKFFYLPKLEGHRVQLRAEAFNAFNNVNFTTPSLSLAAPSTFGQLTGVMQARVMQFALRYEF
ncbi:MAG: DUF2012 domain-containing protein [Acidobacteria bacterium]|nr:DUF2012 domain-containing protein [Acidobacteriota bacterium]